jgi:hypothetical protein
MDNRAVMTTVPMTTLSYNSGHTGTGCPLVGKKVLT